MDGLTPFQTELLLALAEEQERYERGDWDFQATLWSRVSYRLGKKRGADRPSPVPGKRNLSDGFRSRFSRAVGRLISLRLVRKRSIRDDKPQPRVAMGYHLHRLRTKDIFLTAQGKAWAAAQRSKDPPARSSDAPPPPPAPAPAPLGRRWQYVSVPAPVAPAKPRRPSYEGGYGYTVALVRTGAGSWETLD